MVRSMFSGVSGLRAHQRKMDVIGNNIANVNTTGYKSSRVTFTESLYQATAASSNGTATYGGKNGASVGYGSQVSTIDLQLATGAYSPTDSGLDCMIDGEGFFMVGAKNDAGFADTGDDASKAIAGLFLTRAGNFSIDGDGYLVDANKNVVYGYNYKAGAAPTTPGANAISPIRAFDGTDPADIYSYTGATINSSGEVTLTKADKSTIVIGKIGVVNVPNANALEKTSNGYYKAVANTGKVLPYGPGDGATGKLISYGLDMSNVDLASQFTDMITTQRGFQANSKIITVTDSMLEELVNLKR
ncbi:MAG: flagellar hook-basal body complex protein [Lachnospiraceae bacterium]|nr:flagellar hook-basal body complex protein [Lachnospiraceae bacterium]